MDHQALFARILQTVDAVAYHTPTAQVDGPQRRALEEIAAALAQPRFDPAQVRTRIEQLHAAGQLDALKRLSALHVVACHPRVADWSEAARLAGEQELAALELGGPDLSANLASVDRHRGVLAFLRGHAEVALEHFTRALERERTAENLGNVLACLIRLDDLADARALLAQVRRGFPAPIVAALERAVAHDPDLVLLRSEAP